MRPCDQRNTTLAYFAMSTQSTNIFGIMGGMGPLASAEFLKTIYQFSSRDFEQELPIVFLISDPTFVDRTQALLGGREETLIQQVNEGLLRLVGLNCTMIVISCITVHHLLPKIQSQTSAHVRSLLDVIFERVLTQSTEKYLIMCTSGTRYLNIFQRHEQWIRAKENLVFPDERDQLVIHQSIYELKKGASPANYLLLLDSLLKKYKVCGYVTACTELHMLVKHVREVMPSVYLDIDPLMIVAEQLNDGSIWTKPTYSASVSVNRCLPGDKLTIEA